MLCHVYTQALVERKEGRVARPPVVMMTDLQSRWRRFVRLTVRRSRGVPDHRSLQQKQAAVVLIFLWAALNPLCMSAGLDQGEAMLCYGGIVGFLLFHIFLWYLFATKQMEARFFMPFF